MGCRLGVRLERCLAVAGWWLELMREALFHGTDLVCVVVERGGVGTADNLRVCRFQSEEPLLVGQHPILKEADLLRLGLMI